MASKGPAGTPSSSRGSVTTKEGPAERRIRPPTGLLLGQRQLRLFVAPSGRARVRRVYEVHDARAERLGRDQLEVAGRVAVCEQPQPLPSGRGMDEQVQLVEQPGVEELAHDRHAPADRDAVDRRVLLERGDGLGEIAL